MAPRVPNLVAGLLALIAFALLLGPAILGVQELLRKLEIGRSGRPSSGGRPGRSTVIVAVLVSALVVGISVYLVGERTAQRRVQEERREFAEKQAQALRKRASLEREKRNAEREVRQKRSAIEVALAKSRLNASRMQVAAAVKRARREYWSWESLLLRHWAPQPATRAIMQQVGQDLRNIAVASGRVESAAEAKRLNREIRSWIKGNSENRELVESGARRYHPVRFTL